MSDAGDNKTRQSARAAIKSSEQMTEAEASPAVKSAPANLRQTYQRSAGAFDELLAENGAPRPHYTKLLVALEEFSPAEFQRRRDTCERLVHEQGITYHVYDDPRGMERPWQL